MSLALGIALIGAWVATPAHAQVIVTNLHPAGASHSYAYGIDAGQQVGYATMGGIDRASLWSGSAGSWVSLHPNIAISSRAFGISAGQQVGTIRVGGPTVATLWTGSAASWVSLNPPGATSSQAWGVYAGNQVGEASFGGAPRAGIWGGSGASWLSLHPGQLGSSSVAYGIGSGQVAAMLDAYGDPVAGVWNQSTSSWVNLGPPGSIWSGAYGVHNGEQVGWAILGYFKTNWHAFVWRSYTNTGVDLHPAGATLSVAYGVHMGQQVGQVSFGAYPGVPHASLWSGTAESWVDLHTFLPAEFQSSEARGIWRDAGITYVVGYGFNGSTGRNEALMWKIPEPGSGLLALAAMLGMTATRHRRADSARMARIQIAKAHLNNQSNVICPRRS